MLARKINFRDPVFLNNPYPLYRILQRDEPVSWSDSLQGWLLVRAEDGAVAGRNPEVGEIPMPPAPIAAYPRMISGWMLHKTGSTHTEARSRVRKPFAGESLAALGPRIERIVHGILDKFEDQGGMDFSRDFARPLPSLIMAELMGIPPEECAKNRRWAEITFTCLGVAARDPERMLRIAEKAADDWMKYLARLFEQRRREPREDIISAFAAERNAEEQLLGECTLLFGAGYVTTRFMLGNGLKALFDHPEQFALLRENSDLLKKAVEEMLRYDSSLQCTGHTAITGLELGGQSIKAGDSVLTFHAAANRDPERYEDPDKFDITRNGPPHVSFGQGPHHCRGAQLFRLEAEIAYRVLLERFPNVRPAEQRPVRALNSVSFRGFNSLPVRFN